MIRRLLLTYLTITMLTLAALAIPLGFTFSARERERYLAGLEREAYAVAALVEEPLEHGRGAEGRELLASYTIPDEGSAEVIDATGRAFADNGRFTGPPDSADIRDALAGRTADGTLRAEGGRRVFATVPAAAGTSRGAVRVSVPASTVAERTRDVWAELAALSAVVLVAVTVVGLLVARGVTRPIRHLEDASNRLADGDLGVRAENTAGVPEMRSLARTFNATAGRLQALVGAQQRFVADAAHELRTPLTALRLRLENLEAKLPTAELANLDAAYEELARLSRLVDGLLTLARNEDAATPGERVDLAAVAAERVDGWAPVAAEDGVDLRQEVPPGTVVYAPADSVEQMLDNLVANAVAACSPGGRVVIGAMPQDRAVLLRVTDDGCGLSSEDRERAFDRFWRADRLAPGGTGLGLPIVRRLARAAGGDAHLEANPAGAGTVAVVRLPCPPERRT